MAVAINYENYQKYKAIAHTIDTRFSKIWEATSLSSRHEYEKNPDYQELLKYGPKLIPYVVHHMLNNKADWVHISLIAELSQVKNVIPEAHQGRFYPIIADWLNWYINSQYYENDDAYHGLVD